MIREVFWGKNASNQKLLMAVSSSGSKPEILEVVVFLPESMEEEAFLKIKNDLFDKWRNGEEVTFPKKETIRWDFKEKSEYPETIPKPDPLDKAESIVRKIRKNIFQYYSTAYRTDIQHGLEGFDKKISSLREWNKENQLFLQNFETIIREAQDLFSKMEKGGKWEDTEWLTNQDAYELRQVLKEIQAKLEALFQQTTNTNYHKIQIQLQDFVVRSRSGMSSREIKENAHLLKDEIREQELSRQHRDDLFQQINTIVDSATQKQAEERGVLEKVSAMNYEDIEARINELVEAVNITTSFQEIREILKLLRAEIRDSSLLHGQRRTLNDKLDSLFLTLSDRQTEDKKNLGLISETNYNTLLERLDIGKRLAAFNEHFQETREYLKSLQQEVFDTRLTREHRDLLKIGLNEAFEKVNSRADKVFAERKKMYEKKGAEMEALKRKKRQEWEFRMKEKIIYMEKNIKSLQITLEKDTYLLEQQTDRWEETKEEQYHKNITTIQAQIAEKSLKISDLKREIEIIEQKLKEE